MEDPPLQVHSHLRSGTHLLMASIAANFELGNLDLDVELPGQRWHGDGRPQAIVPWGRLFGDHNLFPHARTPPDKIVYIVRDPRDTMYSLWRFVGEDVPFEDFACVHRVRYWLQHASGYCAHVHWVRYEDLTGTGFEDVLASIGRRFGLQRKHGRSGSLQAVRTPVGWSAGPGRSGYWREWSATLRNRFASVVPDGFLGYSMR